MKSITIIGSGLAGALLALYMAKRGYDVDMFEARPDVRTAKADKGRSINLAMSCRGLTGLEGVNLRAEVEKIMVPMRARAIHELDGEITFQSFGRHHHEYINAIQRSDLNALLLNHAAAHPRIRIRFNTKLISLDVEHKRIELEDQYAERFSQSYEVLIGADGAASYTRELLTQQKRIKSTRMFLPHGYKELSISSNYPEMLVREHLHLWPRNSFMLLGNPNQDHSITGSLFLAKQGKNSFAALNDEDSIRLFFKQAFPDVYQAMPDLVGEFKDNPVGSLSNIDCSPWYYEDQCLLLGDAAHGVVPFFGQGMNSAFEDCRILNELLEQYNNNWHKVMPAFFHTRKPNTDAVAAMSMANYHEIQSDIRDQKFNLKKQIEQKLMQHYPNRYISKHVLVMFTNTPYAQALAQGQLQEELLDKICKRIKSIEEIKWKDIDGLINQYDKKLARFTNSLELH